MDNNEKYAWMYWLCDPIRREDQKMNNRGINDYGYSLSIHPMVLTFNGQPWAFASNGAASLLVRDRVGCDWEAPSDAQAPMIHCLIKKEICGKLHPLAVFRRWLGTGWKSELPCQLCAGDWARNCNSCFGIGTCLVKCGGCGEGHDCVCSNCVGRGAVFCEGCVGVGGFKKKPGHFRGIVFDRALLSRFLAHVDDWKPDVKVRIMADHKAGPIWVEDEDRAWRAAIMPLREPEARSVPGWRR